ncbi:hypothetical protein [Stenotrophomonas sp.]|jgi:hypothetical protein|uniref:hypothetical protein n=1 Tax=Stenotrophomonas sp. TaxID=69392 RepID=UPI0028A6B724|nr:hypothetical protein [Stenotrophomonas sp.]
MKPNPEVLGIVEGLREQVLRGEVKGLFVLAQMRDGEYACDYFTPDVGDLRLELGSEVMRMGCE